jgi:hypothetical protein
MFQIYKKVPKKLIRIKALLLFFAGRSNIRLFKNGKFTYLFFIYKRKNTGNNSRGE